MKLTIDNQLITLAELRAAWRQPVTVILGGNARRRVSESNELIADVVAGGEQVYGVNTGFGNCPRFESVMTSSRTCRKTSSAQQTAYNPGSISLLLIEFLI